MNKTVVFDFDGVIHKYSEGWKDGSIYDEANKDVIDLMYQLTKENYSVAIVSTRDPIQISEWWNSQLFPIKAVPYINNVKFFNETDYIGVFNYKIPALIYIDDRAFKFDPLCTNLFNIIKTNVPYVKAQENYMEADEYALLGMLQVKNKIFEDMNKLFDEKLKTLDDKQKGIINLNLLDDWITALQKYL